MNLDFELALEFGGVDDELVELLINRMEWRSELAALTGFMLKHWYLWSDRDSVNPPIVTVYSRHFELPTQV